MKSFFLAGRQSGDSLLLSTYSSMNLLSILIVRYPLVCYLYRVRKKGATYTFEVVDEHFEEWPDHFLFSDAA